MRTRCVFAGRMVTAEIIYLWFVLLWPTLSADFHLFQHNAVCQGEGNATQDWLVAGCGVTSSISTTKLPDGSILYSLTNGIITRELTHNKTSNTLSTTAIKMNANATSTNLVITTVPEASFTIDGVHVLVGGIAEQFPGSKIATFYSAHVDLAVAAGGYTWIPGTRGSNPNASWPPKGTRVDFVHIMPCTSLRGDLMFVLSNELIRITVVYEQFDGTSGFSRRIRLSHNCSGAPLNIMDINMDYLALTDLDYVEFQSDTEAGIAKSMQLADGTRAKVLAPYSAGSGVVGLTSSTNYTSYLMTEIFHSTSRRDTHTLGGVDRFARESSKFWRLVTPQIEQMVVYAQAICVGGTREPPADGSVGSVGYWCYDEEGTHGIERLIDQSKEMKIDMLVFGQNMNSSWRSMVGPEFNSEKNLSWFSSLVARARNNSAGQHPVEVGIYQLLLNARSATAYNQAAPGNAFDLQGHGFDAMDPTTLLPDHNGGKTECQGGPSCASLCAGTSFFHDMKSTMLEFWRMTKVSVIDQDGSRYMPCSNTSHAHHHGFNDSMRVQYEEVKRLFHEYLDIPGGFPVSADVGKGLPRVAFVTSASSNFLEAGQAKVPGGYNEYVWSLPRWHWIDLQRVLIIRGVNELVNVQRYYPVPLSMPYHDVQYNPDDPLHWKSCYGYETNATLTPLEKHLPELEWVLSQTFGTGIMAQLRSRYLYDGPQSRALLQRWIHWFRRYQGIVSQDFVTLSLATNCVNETQPTMQCHVDDAVSIDAIVHHNNPGILGRADFPERALVLVWNPALTSYKGQIHVPLYYSGLTRAAGVESTGVSYAGSKPIRVPLTDSGDEVVLEIQLGPRGLTWIVVYE